MTCTAVAATLAAMAPAGVVTGCRPITPDDVDSLRPVEAAAVRHAVAKRRHEFATGRALLRELVGTDAPIPVMADRRPELPDGVVGSLAHTATLAIAVVAPSRSVDAVGVDLEPATPLDSGMAALIVGPEEAEAHGGGLDPHLAFVLKEAVYKVWSGLGGRLLDHDDVRLDVELDRADAGRFGAVADGALRTEGRWALVAGHWIALVVEPAPGGRRDRATAGGGPIGVARRGVTAGRAWDQV